MNKTITLLIIGAIAMASTVYRNSSSQGTTLPYHVVIAFHKWRLAQNKVYSTPSEAAFRLGVFYRNFVLVKNHNASDSTYTMGLNQFSDMTVDEFRTKATGFRFTGRQKNFVNERLTANPTSIDWVAKGVVNAVKNQGQCGSCWAFSAVANMESVWKINKGTLYSLSEQQLVDCSRSYGNYGCNGGLMDNAFKYVKDHGITTESSYPYKARDQNCKYSGQHTVTVQGYNDVPSNNCQVLEDFVAKQPTSVAIAADAIMQYQSGIFNDPNCGTRLDHGVTAVGYGAQNGISYWKVRNSWGANWGENGYIRMFKSTASGSGMCGICMAASTSYV